MYTLFLQEYLAFGLASMFLNFSDFEPEIVLQVFLNTEGVTSPKILRNIFQSSLMFYYIIMLTNN